MLTVLSVGYPLARVGPDAVGGAEQILSLIDHALAREGHRSLVVACEGSNVSGSILTTPRWEGKLDSTVRRRAVEHVRERIAQALRQWPVDLVHLHGIDSFQYLPPPPVPTLITLHLPPSWYPPEIFSLRRPRTFLNCVSAAQRKACPPCPYLLESIPNGVPEALLGGRHAKRNFALSLGRVCPEKGFHFALEAAAQAGVPLLLAGEVFGYEAHRAYFEREILPRLDRRRRFIGPIGWKRTRRLLTAARCLLVPSLAPETSSLVAMEAMACGTPVIAYPAGALAEIVEEGRTGFLVKSPEAMAAAITAVGSIDPEQCRQTARERFSAGRMTERYVELYQRLAAVLVHSVPVLNATMS